VRTAFRCANAAASAVILVLLGFASAPTYLFDDEFTGPAGSAPNPAAWWRTDYCTKNTQNATCWLPANAFLDGAGHLVLRATPCTTRCAHEPYEGGRVQGFSDATHAALAAFAPPVHIEVRAEFSGPYAGLWQGIWAVGVNWQGIELDAQEYRGLVPTQDTCHVHLRAERGAVIDTGFDGSAAYHTYWVNYNPDHAVFGVDKLTCGSVSYPTTSQSVAVMLSSDVGVRGTWGGQSGPPPLAAFPADVLVDYVRVWAL
jgi:hypothetical protein